MLAGAVVLIGALVATAGSARVVRARRAEGEALDCELRGMLGTTNRDRLWMDVIDLPAPSLASSRWVAMGAAGALLGSVAHAQGVLEPALGAAVINATVLVQVLRQRPLGLLLPIERQALIPIRQNT